VNVSEKIITPLKKLSFSDKGLKERYDLQEWIDKNPECLCTSEGERLLIIQKEYDGFDGTYERLDLLALDQNSNLVIIENKTDDSGTDVNWQAIKYTAYCSTLKTEEIIDIYQDYLIKYGRGNESASENILSFLNEEQIDDLNLNTNQRTVLVAAKFSKEVTATSLWLFGKGIPIECYKVSLFEIGKEIIFHVDKIIPLKDSEEYVIKKAAKELESAKKSSSNNETYLKKKEFFIRLKEEYKKIDSFFDDATPSPGSWFCSWHLGCSFEFWPRKNGPGVKLNISTANSIEVFNALFAEKEKIEEEIGHEIHWNRKDQKSQIIEYSDNTMSFDNEEDWPRMIEFMCTEMNKFVKTFNPRLDKIIKKK